MTTRWCAMIAAAVIVLFMLGAGAFEAKAQESLLMLTDTDSLSERVSGFYATLGNQKTFPRMAQFASPYVHGVASPTHLKQLRGIVKSVRAKVHGVELEVAAEVIPYQKGITNMYGTANADVELYYTDGECQKARQLTTWRWLMGSAVPRPGWYLVGVRYDPSFGFSPYC